jgi:hypothetical protein
VTFQVIKKADKKVGGLIDYFLPRRALLPENVSPEAEQKEKIHTFARSQSDLTVNRTAWHLKTQREWPSRTALLG